MDCNDSTVSGNVLAEQFSIMTILLWLYMYHINMSRVHTEQTWFDNYQLSMDTE